jgi:hypothetical protein
MVNTFEATLDLSEFTSVNTAINANAFTKIYKKQIPAKQILAWGAGAIVNGVDIREDLKLDIQDASATIVGKVRISITDANEANSKFGKEFSMADLVTGKKLGLRNDLAVGEDAYLVIEMMAKTGTPTIVPGNCTGSIPVTKQLINNI